MSNFGRLSTMSEKAGQSFLDIPWFETEFAYDVSPAYLDTRMPIFDRNGRTMKVVCPFKWDHLYQSAPQWGCCLL